MAVNLSQHCDTDWLSWLASDQSKTPSIRGAGMSQFAPFGTLFRYFALRFAGWVCLCLFGLVSIISSDPDHRACASGERFDTHRSRYKLCWDGR